MTRSLEAHDLGEKAESWFRSLCIDAQLIASKSERDITGWDFLIEDKKRPAGNLDSRPGLRLYKVQVKGKWLDNHQIKMTLSSLDHLAKALEPAFIYIARADDKGAFIAARIIQMSGDFLSFVLAKLREAQADKRRLSEEVSFQIDRFGEEIAADGDAFRAFIDRAVGKDQASYLASKRYELDTLGYSDDRYRINAAFGPATPKELIEGFLGLRKLTVDSLAGQETRFDIPLPMPEFPSGASEIEVRPKPVDRCKITVGADGNNPKAIFDGKIFQPPKALLEPNQFVWLIRSDLFRLLLSGDTVRHDETNQLDFSLTVEVDRVSSEALKPSQWCNFYRMVSRVWGGGADLLIKPRTRATMKTRITPDQQTEIDADWPWLRISEHAMDMFDAAGAPNAKVTMDDLRGSVTALDMFNTLVFHPERLTAVSFQTAIDAGIDYSSDQPLLFFGELIVGNHRFSHCLKLSMNPVITDTVTWTSISATHVAITKIRFENDIRQFVDRMRRQTRIDQIALAFGLRGPEDDLNPPL